MKMTKKRWICGGAALLSLTVCGVLTLVGSHIAGLHESQYAAQRWEADGDIPYAQMSAFLTEDACLTEENLQSIRDSVNAAMRTASLEKASETARLWYDAYSAPAGLVQASGTKRYSAQAEVTAVGGDFFTLHRDSLLDGSYLLESDLMQDRVILDETLAWQLFGSPNVAGMTVQIGQRMYPIAGVVAQEQDYATKRAYGEIPRMYIPFDLFAQWQAENGDTAMITCYEMVLPDPVRNFAKNAFDQALGAENNRTMKTLRNTDRYSISASFAYLKNLHEIPMVSEKLVYPYWENAARIVEFDIALLFAAGVCSLILPLLVLLWIIWKAYRRLDAIIVQKRKAHKNRFRSLIHTEEGTET